jgi:[ribosomal protein S5]-alanine N-acetyltransferase
MRLGLTLQYWRMHSPPRWRESPVLAMDSEGARTLIETERLELVAPDPALAEAALGFFERNRAHLAPWEPPIPEGFYSVDFQRERLAAGAASFGIGSGWRWWLRLRGTRRDGADANRLIGHIHFSQVARGPFHNAMLGYALDATCEGQGFMSEALRAGIAEVFGPVLRLHRIQANVRPENQRSLALLERLGFEREGFARQYLFIAGAWRDHVMTALRNPAFTDAPKAL